MLRGIARGTLDYVRQFGRIELPINLRVPLPENLRVEEARHSEGHIIYLALLTHEGEPACFDIQCEELRETHTILVIRELIPRVALAHKKGTNRKAITLESLESFC